MSIVVFLLTDQINLFMSFPSFSFYLALVTRKYFSIEKRICFKKKLTVARDQLPKNIPVTYFPYSFLCRNIVKVHSYHFNTKCFKIRSYFSFAHYFELYYPM